MYIYPDNLKSKAVLWLWELRDIAIIGVGALISVFAMAQLGFLPPVVITAAYAFLSIRLEDTSTALLGCRGNYDIAVQIDEVTGTMTGWHWFK